MQLFGYSENPTRPPTFQGRAELDPPVPELVRIKPDDPNRLGKFDFELLTPNQWSGVTLEIKGQADQDGQYAAETTSAGTRHCRCRCSPRASRPFASRS